MGIAGGTISALGYSLGPVIGGVLTHAFGWRSNFYLSGALALVGFAAARALLPPESFKGSSERKEPFDFVGAVSFAFGISALLSSLAVAQKGDGQGVLVVLTAVAGAGVLGFFVWWESQVKYPLLDLNLFRIPAFSFGNAARWISFITMSISNLLMPFFLQFGMGLDPLRAGFLVAPTPFAMALLAPLTGWMSERFAPERLCALGLAINGGSCVLLAFLPAGASAVQIILGLALLGVGMGIFQTPNNNLLMSSVPRNRLGVGSSVLSIVRSLGYSVGAALAAAIVSSQLAVSTGQTSLQFLSGAAAEIHSSGFAAFMRGFRLALLVAAVLCFIGAAISAVRVSREQV